MLVALGRSCCPFPRGVCTVYSEAVPHAFPGDFAHGNGYGGSYLYPDKGGPYRGADSGG